MDITSFFVSIKIPLTVLHVVSVVFGMGSALVSDMLFNFYSEDRSLSHHELKTLRLLSNVVWISLIVISVSGIGIFLSDIAKYSHSIKFLAKMSVLGILVVNGYVLHHFVWSHVEKRGFLINPKEALVRRVAFACGAISLVSWLTVCALGVLDSAPYGYLTIMAIYGTFIISAIAVALGVEYLTFERMRKITK